MTDKQDTFWQDIQLPINEEYEENGYDIVNPVDVAEKFILAISYSTALGERAESLTQQLADLEIERDKKQRELNKLRRLILSENLPKLKSSWGSEIVEGFILASAGDKTASMKDLEVQVEQFDDKIAALKPKVLKAEKRLKLLEKNMEWARQFLDYDKLLHRIKMSGRQ